jgi:hypothetical protein
MSKYDSFRARWNAEVGERPSLYGAKIAFLRGCAQADEVREHFLQLANDPNLSPAGRTVALRKYLKSEVMPAFRQAREGLKKTQADVQAERAKIGEIKIDRSDVVSAMLRAEVRTWLRGLSPAVALSALIEQKDSLIMAAVLEAPAVLSGVPEAAVGDIRERLVAQQNPEAMVASDEALEAVAMGEAALQIAMQEILAAANVQTELQLDHMLANSGT